jgi:hypothetical protein
MEHAWTREIEDIARELKVNLNAGLTHQQVVEARAKYGTNGISLPCS